MKLLVFLLATAIYAEDAPKQSPTPQEQEISAKDATIQRQQQLIQALQAKITALLAYMSADEQIRTLQVSIKEQPKQ